jgi:uncharacterized Zn finger protein
MSSVAELVEEPALRRLARPDSFEEGARWAEAGVVRIVDAEPHAVTAEVRDADPCQVELRTAHGELEWTCSCGADADGNLCSHGVAAAVVAGREMGPPPEGG